MENAILRHAVDCAVTMGPAVLMPGMQLRRPMDVLRSPSISVDDKRAILAAWASDFYAVDSKPAFRQLPGLDELISIDEIQSALKELDGLHHS
ncbi:MULTISPECIES: hypothetical protein [unclassified Rhizobium]|uniref:hypothetical protein n=1 Tax=unclassified Rhizobium TaxID=2613769 RepID=UPI0038190652